MIGSAVRATLDAEPDLRVVGLATRFDDGVVLVGAARPTLALVDDHVGDVVATDHLDRFRAASPTTKVVVLTGWPSERSLLAALDAGAAGYLIKRQSLDEVKAALRRAAAGEVVVAPELMPMLVARAGGRGVAERPTLTRRELEVLRLLAAGVETREIAEQLHLSVNTVRNHVSAVLAKLGARSRLQAVREAVRVGIIDATS